MAEKTEEVEVVEVVEETDHGQAGFFTVGSFDFYKFLLVAIFSMCGVLYAQQNNNIQRHEKRLAEVRQEVKDELDKKVDNALLYEMLKTINLKQAMDVDLWKEQKKLNAEILLCIKRLNTNVLLLNQKLKLNVDAREL